MPDFRIEDWVTVEEELEKPKLLVGNGFSIALRPDIFAYGSLFDRADFTKLGESARKAFDALSTRDFEAVIQALQTAELLAECYETSDPELSDRFRKDAEGLRELLVNTIAGNHPSHPGEVDDSCYRACREFLRKFECIYTLSYDLLLYWTVMHEDGLDDPPRDDGFRRPDEGMSEYVVWNMAEATRDQTLFYLHGALHLFDAGAATRKYTWVNTGERLISQIRTALNNRLFPMIVAEGTSQAKLEKIMHSAYLARALRSLQQIGGDLVVFGMALSDNDEHVLNAILVSKVKRLFVGVYGDPSSEFNRALMTQASQIAIRRGNRKPLGVRFIDASAVKPWG